MLTVRPSTHQHSCRRSKEGGVDHWERTDHRIYDQQSDGHGPKDNANAVNANRCLAFQSDNSGTSTSTGRIDFVVGWDHYYGALITHQTFSSGNGE
jgi:hypothetical protein